jgi:hypothetical protein
MTPDHARLGGIGWLERTNGSLTKAERRRLVPAILRGQASGIAGRLALLARRRAKGPMTVPTPPDSRLARDAEEAAAEQPAAILGHSYRTWAFGRALVAVDGESVDEELFYVASLLHDAGLADVVTGEDFTLRSGRLAAPIVETHRGLDAARHVCDAISAHATPGASVAVDGPEAFYVQSGATLDLGGLRLHHLSADLVDSVLAAHSREGVVTDISARITAEAAAVPDGRFALLKKTGFLQALRLAPLPK